MMVDPAEKGAALSPAELRVMALVARGKPNKLIAHELCVVESTIKAHVQAILKKLGLTNRVQVALTYCGIDVTDQGRSSEEVFSSIIGFHNVLEQQGTPGCASAD